MTFVQTSTGRAFDLFAPTPDQVDFEVIAGALSKIPRFNGHIQAGAYSVAQHCVMGAELLIRKERPREALAFMLHDAHEAFIGEISRPVMGLIKFYARNLATMETGRNVPLATFDGLFDQIKAPIDRAICAAAGVPNLYPWPEAVRELDDAMLEAERRQLLGERCERPWQANNGEPARLTGRIRVWSHADAEIRWLDLFDALRPTAKPKAVQAKPLSTTN